MEKRAEPTPLMDCIREQEWESDEEREQAMKELAEWFEEHAPRLSDVI